MNRNWRVRVECVVIKDVYVTDCTAEQAMKDPWSHAGYEEEVDQKDWKVINIEPE